MGNACPRRDLDCSRWLLACPGRRSGTGPGSEPLIPSVDIQRYCRPLAGQTTGSYGMVLSFLEAAKRDGYISAEDYNELVKATQDMQLPVHEAAAHERNKRVRRDSQAALMLPGMDFAAELGFRGHRGPKKRGSSREYPTISRILESGEDAEIVLHSIEFNCLSRGDVEQDTAVIVYGFSQPVNYLGRYEIDAGKLKTWLQAIGDQYTSAAYHNWRHAFDVFQLAFLALTDGGMHNYFNNQDAMVILVGAIAHDVGHAGTNNAFQMKAYTTLAITYNDKSPLENMHASLAFETLKRPGANFLESLPTDDFQCVRSKLVDVILETDPSKHFEFVEQLSARMSRGPILTQTDVKSHKGAPASKELEESNKTDRRLLLLGAVHMWDIGNAFRPWSSYKKLVAALEEEFFLQGDKEREVGLPITPMMDRSKESLAGGQGFFLGKLVLPLFDLYSKFIQDGVATVFRGNLVANMEHWQCLVKKHGAKSAGEILRLEDEEEKAA